MLRIEIRNRAQPFKPIEIADFFACSKPFYFNTSKAYAYLIHLPLSL